MRRVRRKGASKDKVFGCDLLEHLNATGQDVPQVLRCCCQFVEEHGVVDGIYRLSGVSSNIQKLRSEFESEGTPDLSKEVYLQDIHCVSSLCKAYFRELPNPLLTYQLYDKFAEAVAVQLEEERLVKIRDVLKDLPPPHYRTLEFLMCHLVKMASSSPETNMHARNLAIVWAPNLLRSKDIEVSGFNGTAAFMEVRVQSIVVEFILTHVSQLFPDPSVTHTRRKSLPSPSEEPLFKAQPPANFGHISPGDGPIPIRPYHAIIEGTDKRKGSFKGRKWMSIFNIGNRFYDPRRRHKHSAKEKDRPVLRPARSMDSLSIPPYSNEDSVRPLQTSRSAKMSGLELAASPSPLGGSEYAVTYRRGTGLVGGGTQGTYTALDPEGLGGADGDAVQSRSPGLSTKAGRRAAMHITGPTLVTVPLHITSNLAMGLLQGGGSDRVVHRGRDKDGGDKEGGDNVERKDSGRKEMKDEGVGEAKEETIEVTHRKEIILDEDANTLVDKEEEDMNEESVREECRPQPEAKETSADVYEEMQGGPSAKCEDNNLFDSSGVLNSTEDDQELSGYIQDSFEFLDHMDCSVSCQIPLHFLQDCASQVNEFSVEPPGHSDDEYEFMEQPSHHATGPDIRLSVSSETSIQSQPTLQRPHSVDSNERHAKSLSLPYMTSPVCEPGECCYDDEDDTADDDTPDFSSSDEESSLFAKSLPADFFLSNVCDLEPENVPTCVADALVEQSCEAAEYNPKNSTGKRQNQSQDDMDGVEETIPRNEPRIVHQEEDTNQRNEDLRTQDAGPAPLPLEMPSHNLEMPHECVDLQEHRDESSVKANDDVEVDKIRQEDEGGEHHFSVSDCAKKETSLVEEFCGVSEETTEEFREDQNDSDESKVTKDVNPETIISMSEGLSTEDCVVPNMGKTQEGSLEMEDAKIWDELEEVVCELIEDEERKTMEVRDIGEVNEMDTTGGKNPEETDINLPERCDQEGVVMGKLVPKEDEAKLEEVTVMLSHGASLKEVGSDAPKSGEGINFMDQEPERSEQEGEVTQLLVPNGGKPTLEKVTVTPSLTDKPLKDVWSDALVSGECGTFDNQGSERTKTQGTITEKLTLKEDRPICEEVTKSPTLRDGPLKEVMSDISEYRDVRVEEHGPEKCEQEKGVTELFVPSEGKPISTVTPSLRHTHLKEVRSDVLESGECGRSEKQGPETSKQEGTVAERLLSKEDAHFCEKGTVTPTPRDKPLKEVMPDILESREDVRFEEHGPDRCEQEGEVTQLFVPNEGKPILEKVTVTPSLRHTPLKEVRSDVLESGECGRFENQEPERYKQEGTVMKKLVLKEEKPICGEGTVTPTPRDKPLKEVMSDILESREDGEEHGQERCEQEREITELFVPNKGQPILQTVTPSLRDAALKEVRSDVPESRDDVRFEERGPVRSKQESTCLKKLVLKEEKTICEEMTVPPSLRERPLKEVRSEIPEFRDSVRFESATREKLVSKEDKPICEKVTGSLGDTPLKEVRADVSDSRDGGWFEERGPDRCEHEGAVIKKDLPKENKPIYEEETVPQSVKDTPLKELRSDVPDSTGGMRFEERGVGRKLIISKLPKVYQVKAVPVVPPKPQHCKLAARSLRQQQQQQQRERRDAEAPDDVSATCGKDTSRNSPLSMCFDEAVAIATMRREKERVCERERQRDWVGEVQ
ncbi:uncharacterized protein LOC144015691 [Festucalex cinctus]